MWIKEETPVFDHTKAEIFLEKNVYGNLKVKVGETIRGHWWHYELDGKIVSYVWLLEKADIQALYNQSGDDSPELEIAVCPEYQEKGGYGFEAMLFGIEQARKLGYSAVFGKVKRENPRAEEVIQLSFMFGSYGISAEGKVLNLEESLQYYKQVAPFTLKMDLL
jgi:hypothetical protein